MTESQDWNSFPIDLDGKTGFVLVDLAHMDSAPRESHSFLAMIRVPFVQPDDSGFGQDEEVEEIDEIEEQLAKRLAALGGLHVAHVRGGGAMDIFAYLPEAAVEKAQDVIAETLGAREHEVGIGEDAEWGMYREQLFPGPEQMQWTMDMQLTQQFAQTGNNLSLARPVDFHLCFPDIGKAGKFADAAKAEGFATEAIEQSDDGGDLPIVVHLVKQSDIEFETIHPVSLRLMELAAEHEGLYDGWAAETDQAIGRKK